MDLQTLVKTDLNLLTTLYAVYEHKSVSLAAKRLFITQSAVSKALSRVRVIFDDPLFIRSGNQLVATPFLDDLAPRLIDALTTVDSVLKPTKFNPEHWQGEIKIAFPESIDLVLTVKLLTYLRKVAPHIAIQPSHDMDGAMEKLANGSLDFVITQEYLRYPKGFMTELLFSTYAVLLARKGHPLQAKEVSAAEVIEYPRLSLKNPAWELSRHFHDIVSMQSSILDWEVDIETDSLLSSIAILRATDSLLPIPDILIQTLQETDYFHFIDIAEYKKITYNYMITCHERVNHSPVHKWLVAIVKSLLRDITSERNGMRN